MNAKKIGRPSVSGELRKVPVGYKLPRWLVEWIREQELPASLLIERALVQVYKLKCPKGGKDV